MITPSPSQICIQLDLLLTFTFYIDHLFGGGDKMCVQAFLLLRVGCKQVEAEDAGVRGVVHSWQKMELQEHKKLEILSHLQT